MITPLLPLIAKSMGAVAMAALGCKKWSSTDVATIVLGNVTRRDRTTTSSVPSPSAQATSVGRQRLDDRLGPPAPGRAERGLVSTQLGYCVEATWALRQRDSGLGSLASWVWLTASQPHGLLGRGQVRMLALSAGLGSHLIFGQTHGVEP